ncbi:hypothetical protein [Rhizobium glycinendophyticum]|uniref:Uncharacterized protein n=1 Tax=Rhizobium glycinendophyticum TaxID=2589807 RepID=A0A504U8E8_9HYPH|nr:hypothetical protein [Rhizobium glycinendophyticum]TPP06825.1 hypothetical protein FJQ55_19050 [Rhizobium glycinendophyticum]
MSLLRKTCVARRSERLLTSFGIAQAYCAAPSTSQTEVPLAIKAADLAARASCQVAKDSHRRLAFTLVREGRIDARFYVSIRRSVGMQTEELPV